MASHFLFAVFQLFLITLTVLVDSQNQTGFISIDCGLIDEESYTDETTSISYTSDSTFTSTGISHTISSKHKTQTLQRQFWNLRSFPEGSRNCYTLDAPSDISNSKYLVRARFMYGNYDGKEYVPQFDLFLGAKRWDSVEFEDEESVVTKEIIYSASSGYVHVCLLNTNNGTPFISVLELRVVDSDGFLVSSLELLDRFDLGLQEGGLVRYPDDAYDRIWTPYNSTNWKQINTSLPIGQSSSSSSLYITLPPSIVMSTAETPENTSNNIEFHFQQNSENASTYYAYMYFAEVQELQENQTREFNIFVNGELLTSASPFYLQSTYYLAVVMDSSMDILINETDKSTLPPLINAIEIYMTKDLSQSQTDQTDADAIMNIKSTYGIKRNWQGDPCNPQDYLWDGLNCSYNGSGSQRIISLNLSSSGLIGNIAPDISNLKFLEYLDLSNNSLVGNVPMFLSQLHSLRVLNLEGNQLSGTIPTELTERSQNGSLKFSKFLPVLVNASFGGNPNLCSSDSCKSSKTNVVIPVVASLAGAFILLAAIIAFCIFKRRRQKRRKQDHSYSIIDKELKSKKQQLTYAEVSSITNNFEKLVGKGAFGTVYHGFLGNTQVAVKMLSSSTQGYLQFQAKLLARVHHKCLTALIGFCDDGTNIALIYEYMANGDLAKHLSGLEYLHKGCKPPIIHRDVKSNNILLNETCRGKIADFGLSKMFSEEGDTHVFTVIAGTPGYLDPEYNKSNKLNEKSDVYSFGVVLLEIITGRPAIAKDTEEKAHIVEWVHFMLSEREIEEIVDSRLLGNFGTDCARKALDTAMACVSPTSLNRPTMSEVVMDLRQCLAMETTPSVPYSQIDFSFGGISEVSSLAR
ncbi:putative LRR receptor-like serine/threonine-protein kinase [Senna tora]|uniref:Putative LRR receptor-like serine/threonine-protein kinase n=1 Tax=Senna tora TaxID=362788 RepID=A0A834XD95_9FABA|nr:putative LRR receptor-like serine/threonine-protein kinase [Senna tora]